MPTTRPTGSSWSSSSTSATKLRSQCWFVGMARMDCMVRLWDLPSGKQIGRFGKEVGPFKVGWVLTVAFSPDGRSPASGGLNKTEGPRPPRDA
jgi:WD40 repeat protein